jgi:hypothetical protein
MTMFAPEAGKRWKNCLLVSWLGDFLRKDNVCASGGKKAEELSPCLRRANQTNCLQTVSNSVSYFFYLNIKHLSSIRD